MGGGRCPQFHVRTSAFSTSVKRVTVVKTVKVYILLDLVIVLRLLQELVRG